MADPFSCSPYAGNLNLTDRGGIALYNAGKEELPSKYTGNDKELPTLLYQLEERGKKCCWDNILVHVIPIGTTNHNRNILKAHVFFTQTIIDAFVTQYTNAKTALDARAAADPVDADA